MDVTCERCGTEYEFDETLLSGRGTSVKCTNCGHVFKVYPRAKAEADRATSSWRLKLNDGTIDTIDSLRELQRRIGSGELTPDNEIARGEEAWKTLGSIPELEPFFQAAGVRVPPRVSPESASSVPPRPTSKDSSLPPGRRPRQPTLLGVMPVNRVMPIAADDGKDPGAVTGAGTAAVTEVAATASDVADVVSTPVDATGVAGESSVEASVESYESPYATDSIRQGTADAASSTAPLVDVEDADFQERPATTSRSSVRTSTPPPAYYDDDDDIPDLPGRGWSPLRWLLLVVVVGGLALLGTQWERVARLLGIGSDPALIAAGATEGDDALAEGHPQAYASAIEAYGRSIAAGGDRDPEILASLSRAYALAAQAQIDSGANADSIGNLSAAALSTAQTAVELDPSDQEAKVASADALRLAGDSPKAREMLEEARSMSFSRTAEFFRVDALLSVAESGGDLKSGLRSAKQAAELSPNGIPYLLLLARAEHAAGDDIDARAALQTILDDQPEHPVATQLWAELEAVNADADAGVASDGGVAADAAVTSDAAVAVAAAVTEATQDAAVAAPDAAPSTETVPLAVEETSTEKTAAPKAPATPKPARRSATTRRRTPKKAAYDEYDRLAKAAGDDAFVDGRPPVRDYEWYMRQGRAELAGGNYSRARAFFDSALEARPGSAEAMDGLGRVSTRIEDFDMASRYFRVAAQRGHPDGYFNLGKTYETLGRNEEAVSAYYTYLKRRPSGSHAAAARSAIKTLEPNAKLPPEPEPENEPEPQPEPDTVEPSAQELEPTTP